MSLFYDIEGGTPVCPCCGNHIGYGIMIDGVCEECYINRRNQFEPEYPEPEFENLEKALKELKIYEAEKKKK